MALTFADKAKQMGATSFTPCPKWTTFRVDNATILWEPGVYQGEGTENRVNCCVKSDEAVSKLLDSEKCIVGPAAVCSCVKGENELQHIKAKLSWDKIRFFDMENERVNKPPKLAGYCCNLIFNIKGKWASHGQVGLSLEVQDIQLVEPKELDYKSPFV